MKVLVVDDSVIVSDRIISMLKNIQGVEISGSAQNAMEAMNVINEVMPDLVVSDLRMPGGSGFDIIEKVKKINKSIVVVIMTNYPEPHYRKKCLELGADYFLDKSNDFEKLADIIEHIQNA